MLKVKLSHLEEINKDRLRVAEAYLKGIKNPKIYLPKILPDVSSVWHLFVIRTSKRDELQLYLESHGIHTQIHYPVPPHLSEAYSDLGYRKGDFPLRKI